MNLITEAELAKVLKLPPAKVTHLRRHLGWPHVRLGRFDVRYTEAQVEQIVAMQSATTTKVRGPQQTSRSRGRS